MEVSKEIDAGTQGHWIAQALEKSLWDAAPWEEKAVIFLENSINVLDKLWSCVF